MTYFILGFIARVLFLGALAVIAEQIYIHRLLERDALVLERRFVAYGKLQGGIGGISW